MTEQPDIAVMMMTYNSEPDIRQSLETLAAQTYRNFHLVYVDDCSTDKTFDIAQEYRGRFDHVTMLRNEQNKGVIDNLYNTLRLIEKTVPQAKFFIWACADDWWEPTFLEKTRGRLLENPRAAVCQTWFDTLYVRAGQTTLNKLCTVRGTGYREASQIFGLHYSDVAPTYFNFTLHGLMRMPVLRDIYPDDRQAIAYCAATEFSGLVAMLMHGEIDILPERLIHRRDHGPFADNNPQDPFSRYYGNILLRMRAALSHFPRFLKMRGERHSRLFAVLMWLHLFYFYGILSSYVLIKSFIKASLRMNAATV